MVDTGNDSYHGNKKTQFDVITYTFVVHVIKRFTNSDGKYQLQSIYEIPQKIPSVIVRINRNY